MRWGCKRHLRQTTTKPNHQLTAVVVARECNAMQVSYAERKRMPSACAGLVAPCSHGERLLRPGRQTGRRLRENGQTFRERTIPSRRTAKITVRAPTCRHDQKGGCAV